MTLYESCPAPSWPYVLVQLVGASVWLLFKLWKSGKLNHWSEWPVVFARYGISALGQSLYGLFCQHKEENTRPSRDWLDFLATKNGPGWQLASFLKPVDLFALIVAHPHCVGMREALAVRRPLVFVNELPKMETMLKRMRVSLTEAVETLAKYRCARLCRTVALQEILSHWPASPYFLGSIGMWHLCPLGSLAWDMPPRLRRFLARAPQLVVVFVLLQFLFSPFRLGEAATLLCAWRFRRVRYTEQWARRNALLTTAVGLSLVCALLVWPEAAFSEKEEPLISCFVGLSGPLLAWTMKSPFKYDLTGNMALFFGFSVCMRVALHLHLPCANVFSWSYALGLLIYLGVAAFAVWGGQLFRLFQLSSIASTRWLLLPVLPFLLARATGRPWSAALCWAPLGFVCLLAVLFALVAFGVRSFANLRLRIVKKMQLDDKYWRHQAAAATQIPTLSCVNNSILS